jgi:DNA-binding IclR family transcriptional regulator
MNSELHTTAIEGAFAILEFLDGAQRGWNVSALSRKVGLPKSSTHVIVVTLQKLRYQTKVALGGPKTVPGGRNATRRIERWRLGVC